MALAKVLLKFETAPTLDMAAAKKTQSKTFIIDRACQRSTQKFQGTDFDYGFDKAVIVHIHCR